MTDSPLNEQHLLKINDALAQLDRADNQITMAEQAGIPIPGRREEVAAARKQLLAIKQVYFAGR
jgi:hypothetical protein